MVYCAKKKTFVHLHTIPLFFMIIMFAPNEVENFETVNNEIQH